MYCLPYLHSIHIPLCNLQYCLYTSHHLLYCTVHLDKLYKIHIIHHSKEAKPSVLLFLLAFLYLSYANMVLIHHRLLTTFPFLIRSFYFPFRCISAFWSLFIVALMFISFSHCLLYRRNSPAKISNCMLSCSFPSISFAICLQYPHSLPPCFFMKLLYPLTAGLSANAYHPTLFMW